MVIPNIRGPLYITHSTIHLLRWCFTMTGSYLFTKHTFPKAPQQFNIGNKMSPSKNTSQTGPWHTKKCLLLFYSSKMFEHKPLPGGNSLSLSPTDDTVNWETICFSINGPTIFIFFLTLARHWPQFVLLLLRFTYKSFQNLWPLEWELQLKINTTSTLRFWG